MLASQEVPCLKMQVAKMRMLGWMCGYTRSNRIRNGDSWDEVGGTSVVDKMRKGRLRWFGHEKRCMDALLRRCERSDIIGVRRCKGGSKKYQ